MVKIKQGQYFPADLVLLHSSEYKGICFVETKSLDGETNLKNKSSPGLLVEAGLIEESLNKLGQFSVTCQPPNDSIHRFEGTVEQSSYRGSLDYSNFLCRGSSLRNTDWVLGVVVYTGHETRIMMNSH